MDALLCVCSWCGKRKPKCSGSDDRPLCYDCHDADAALREAQAADQARYSTCDCCGDDCTPTPFGREAALMVCGQCRKDAASVANTGDVCSQCAARCDADGLLDYCGHRLCKACAATEANALHRCPKCGTGWDNAKAAATCAEECQ